MLSFFLRMDYGGKHYRRTVHNQARGEAALAELKAVKFSSAQISEVADGADAPAATKLSNPIVGFFKDHTATGTEFRDNLVSLGMSNADAHYFEYGFARGGALAL